MTNKSLGKYELHEQLGSGSFGAVYKATDAVLGREVALKILHPQLMVDMGFVERFRNEAKVIASLEHPNIVTVYDMGEDAGRVYIAMRYLPGRSLRNHLQEVGRLPFDQALEIVQQVGAGLQAAHARGLVHRDIKPENILFTEEGQAVISDFGLAKAIQASTSSSSSSAGGVGTPSYRAPELWRGKPPASPATDVYSLACIFTEMLSGNRLFDGNTPDEIITKHLVDGAVLPREWPEGVPAGMNKILEKALKKKPEERYQNVGEFVTALESLSTPHEMRQSTSRLKSETETILKVGRIRVEKPKALSTPVRLLLAIAVPLLIVTVAVMFYSRYGRASQYEENYKLAVQAAVGAIGQTDPAVVQHAWESTLYYLDKAEVYKVTQDSQDLRGQAQAELDNLDRIVRLEFHPAIISGLDTTIHVSRMAATESDLYLLNAASGNVLRAMRTNQGYEIDTEFQCAPGAYGDHTVGQLVDLVALMNSNLYNSATLLGIDATGTLLFCAKDLEPRAVPLAAPGLGWKSISAFTLDADSSTLYVLDPTGSAVWSYFWAKDKFEDPNLFFGEQVPQGMNTAIDLAVRGEDLYLLFQDGHVAACVGGGRCVDPDPFTDPRPGHLSGATISDAVFTQMLFAGPSDPSLYMLESKTRAVYRFSALPDALNLQGQFQPTVDQRKLLFTTPVTAMAVSPNRYIFLSMDNQVYFATDVP